MNKPSSTIDALCRRLVPWYRRCRRDLPWRQDRDPYRVWVSEIMLQQTRVEAVVDYFNRFMQRFPDVHALAAAEREQVLKLWQGLGYYSRARNLHAAAQELAAAGGRLPDTYAGLVQLPGIGPYTGAAIAAIAFNRPTPAVDGNVLRVCTRLWALTADVKQARVKNDVRDRLRPVLARVADRGDFTQGLMELGAVVCTPAAPSCGTCPLRADCCALAQDRVHELPVRGRARAVPVRHVAVAMVRKRSFLLLQRRPESAMLGGLWEWPGGEVPPGELAARVRAQTGIRVAVEPTPWWRLTHTYSHFRLELAAFDAAYLGGRLRSGVQPQPAWVGRRQLAELPLGLAAARLLEAVRKRG